MGKRRHSNKIIAGMAVFIALVVGLIYLSFPSEETRIDLNITDGSYKEAYQLLSAKHKENPNDAGITLKFVNSMLALGKYKEARAVIEESNVDHENADWKKVFAFLNLAEKKPREAKKLLYAYNKTDEFWQALGDVYHRLKEYELAESVIFSSSMDKAKIWDKVAIWRFERDDVDGEKEALDNAINNDFSNIELVKRLFNNRIKANDLTNALMAANELKKTNAYGRYEIEALCGLYNANKDYEAAGKLLEELVLRQDSAPADYLALISNYYERKKYNEALKHIENMLAKKETLLPETVKALKGQELAVHTALLAQARNNEKETNSILDKIFNSGITAEKLRIMIYACLDMDGESWLNKAKSLFDNHKEYLPQENSDNALLAAHIAELSGDWEGMAKALSKTDGADASLALARAYTKMKDFEKAWDNLKKAEFQAANNKELINHYLACLADMPIDNPAYMERSLYVDDLMRSEINKKWDADIAKQLFYRDLQNGNVAEANEILKKLAENGDVDLKRNLALAESSLSKNNAISLENALMCMDIEDSDLPRLLYIFRKLGDRDKTGILAGKVEKLPVTPSSLNQLADAYLFIGNQEKALKTFIRLAKMTGRADDWKNGFYAFYADNPNMAVKILDEAEKNKPRNSELKILRLQVYMDAKDYKKAIELYQDNEGLSDKMKDWQLASIGEAYEKTGSAGKARKIYKMALAKNPDCWPAVSAMVRFAKNNDNKPLAARLLREHLEKEPYNKWARIELAELSPENGKKQYMKVAEIIEKEKKPGESDLLLKAMALWKAGKLKEAIAIYKTFPIDKDANIACDYAQLLIDARQYGQAQNLLDKAIGYFPKNSRLYRIKAIGFNKVNDFANAESALKQASKLEPHDSKIWLEIAYYQQKQGKNQAAGQSMAKAGKR